MAPEGKDGERGLLEVRDGGARPGHEAAALAADLIRGRHLPDQVPGARARAVLP